MPGLCAGLSTNHQTYFLKCKQLDIHLFWSHLRQHDARIGVHPVIANFFNLASLSEVLLTWLCGGRGPCWGLSPGVSVSSRQSGGQNCGVSSSSSRNREGGSCAVHYSR